MTMRPILKTLALLTLVLVLFTCSNRYYYVQGLKRAQNPTPGMVYNGLTEISATNHELSWKNINGQQYVLLVSWKADTGYYTKHFDKGLGLYQYNTGNYPIFVT